MSRLARLTLKGFKSIHEMDLELGALNVLIGPNGAGKSNLLSFFRMLTAIWEHRLQLFVGREGGAGALLHYGRKHTPALEATVHLLEAPVDWAYEVTLAAAAPDDLVFTQEKSTRLPAVGAPEVRVYGSGHRESRLFPEGRSLDDAMQKAPLEGAWVFAYYHFHDTSPAAPIKQACRLQDNRWLHDDGKNLAAFLHMLRTAHPSSYERIRDTLRMAAPLFDDFVLAPTLLNPNTIQLEWRERGSDMPFFAYQLSDGTLRFLALATALLQPELPGRPHTIVIDEPELGLHPYAVTLLAEMIRAASKTTQIIVATQSVTLLDALAEPEEVIVVERTARTSGQSTFRRLEPDKLEDWLKEYTLGELWEKNVLGGRP